MTSRWDQSRFGPYEDARFTPAAVVHFAYPGGMYSEAEFAEVGLGALVGSGPVMTWGRPVAATADPAPVPFPELGQGDRWDTTTSTLVTGKRRWFDVRIIPTLEAPNRAFALAGHTLLDAIEKYVAGDLLVEDERRRSGRFFAPLDPIREVKVFPLGLHPVDAALRMKATVIRRGDQHGSTVPESRNPDLLYHQIAVRMNLLVDALKAGEAEATGLLPTNRERVRIDRAWWSRPGLVIDMSTGDVTSANGVIEWFAVAFEQSPAADVQPPQSTGAPSSKPQAVVPDTEAVRTKGSTKGSLPNAVRVAFLELWPDDTPVGMGRKEIDATIRERLGYRRDGDKPSTRTITGGIDLARAEITERRG